MLMELQNITSRMLALLVLMLCLGGCETHLNSEPLEIIGNPPKEMFYDTEFEYQFGTMGGDGLYQYKYIANPEGRSSNPVQLQVDPINDNKPGFWLRGMPTIDSDQAFSSVNERELAYALEVTDGPSTVRREYEFTLKKNALVLSSPQLAIQERQIINAPATQLRRVWEDPLTRPGVCSQHVNNAFEASIVDGQPVYPLVMSVRLKAPSTRRVEISYRFVSGYNEDQGELASVNKEKARPNVDYLDEERTLIFEPGEAVCIIYLNVLDDNQVEGPERLEVNFYNRIGGLVDITGVIGQILIADNEPIPKHEFVTTTANEGDTVTTEFTIPAPYNFPIDILVSKDAERTTANLDDFEIQPQNGRITIIPGQTKASYDVVLKHNDDSGESEDDVVAIKTSLDDLNRIEPFEVAINKWRLSNEVVARESEGGEVVDFTYRAGKIFVLNKVSTLAGEDAFDVVVANADGSAADENVIRVSQQGLNIVPVALIFDASVEKIVVAANVDGRFTGESYYGGRDFVVFSFEKNAQGAYQMVNSVQYGTFGNDYVTGMTLGAEGVYVFGSTTGSAFENTPGTDLNSGGTDGFVYKISADELFKTWSRFIGTVNEDRVVAVSTSRQDLLVLVSTENTDTDVFMRVLELSSGETQTFISDGVSNVTRNQIDISSPEDDFGQGVALMGVGENISAIVNSQAELPSFSNTPSLSTDSFLLFFDTETGGSSGVDKIATALDDRANALEILNDDGVMVAAGMTFGEFDGQVKKGSSFSEDAFVATIAANTIGSNSISKITQFGTISDDAVIKVRRINDHKFMVLWSESSTSGDGSKVFRLSPFSIDGTKLTPDP